MDEKESSNFQRLCLSSPASNVQPNSTSMMDNKEFDQNISMSTRSLSAHYSSEKPDTAYWKVPHIMISGSFVVEEEYIYKTKLGEGTFGVVYSAESKKDNTLWAIKRIKKDRRTSNTQKCWYREMRILAMARHQHVVKLREIFESKCHIYLVMELCIGGTIYDEFKRAGKLCENDCRKILCQSLSAIAYLHSRNIVHRDLKLDNLLFREKVTRSVSNEELRIVRDCKNPNKNKNGEICVALADFGLSVDLRNPEATMLEFCGTPIYMAPEIVGGNSYSKQCDVWSMGIILLVLFGGILPYNSNNEGDLFAEIKRFNASNYAEKNFSSNRRFRHCLSRLLHNDPAYRYTASEALHDPWIKNSEFVEGYKNSNVLELMKEFNFNQEENIPRKTLVEAFSQEATKSPMDRTSPGQHVKNLH